MAIGPWRMVRSSRISLALRLVLVRERERILVVRPPGGDMRDECRVVLRVKRHAEDAAVAGG